MLACETPCDEAAYQGCRYGDKAMITNDSNSPAQKGAKRLRFDRYVLDLDRGCLLLDGNEIALRPKTFAVLRYLIENFGRLVSKDELFAAVWPNLAVTDDALVQSIGELRRGLGDDGPRLIKTIPRRGYRLESAVSIIVPVEPPATHAVRDLVASYDGDRASKPLIRPHAWKLLTTAFTGSRTGLLAAVALVVLLAAGALLVGYSEWRVPNTRRSGEQFAKTAEVSAKPAIAILPLANQNDNSAREYFADGLTQDIINALGRFPGLTVMSWNAVFPYKGKPENPAEIARSLAVRYQVEGSVRQIGDRVRVNAQLVDANGQVLWSASFDEALADVFALQDKITTQIAGTLAIRVTQIEQRRVFTKPTDSLEAYDYVLRAKPALQRPTRANIAEARSLLRRAIELDSNYAAAYTALAETYHVATSLGWAESPTDFLGRAEEMANKALSMDDSDVRARIVLGRIHLFYHRYDQAKAEIDRAIAINPNDANGLAGLGNILMWSGQTDAAIWALELAQRIDPELNAIDRFALSLAYYLKGRYDAAIEQADLNLRKTSGANFSRILLAAAYAQLGRFEDVAGVVTVIRRIDPTFDAQEFGTKFLSTADLTHLRDGLRKAGLWEEASRR
jgi:TolB-like protein/DNA-binding winged helix-turn-helix (wHTH) protein/cytochrome c-type biogenesis protein CcmH/NrfG